RRGDARQRSAVKRIQRRDNFVAAFAVAKLARQLEQSLIGFRAAVAEKHFTGREQVDQRLSQASLRFCVIKVRDVDEFFGLFDQRFGDLRMRVAETTDQKST